MSHDGQTFEYEPVKPLRALREARTSEGAPPLLKAAPVLKTESGPRSASQVASSAASPTDDLHSAKTFIPGAQHPSRSTSSSVTQTVTQAGRSRFATGKTWILKRGHAFSYAGLFLFTTVLYFRPYELFPVLSALSSIAYWVATATLLIFVPSQFTLEGSLTARPREVNFALLMCLAGLLSIPLAINPGEAWATFSGEFIKAILMFVVMVNVVRTERRLKGLILLALAVSLMLSINAISDFRLGRFTIGENRIAGALGGMFANPNDLALYFATAIPLAAALLLQTRNLLLKLVYGASATLMAIGVIITFSRGGFLGMGCAIAVMAWKIGRSNRFAVAIFMLVTIVLFLALAPGDYGLRLISVYDRSLDTGSVSARQDLLTRSIFTALRHPLFGIGMGNFHVVGAHEQVTHNAYTQVASEMGIAAAVIYTMFIVSPLRRLRQIERKTFVTRVDSRIYYLAVGVQASLVAYMVGSFFASVAYLWYVYYLVGYAVCLRRMYEATTGAPVLVGKQAAGPEEDEDDNDNDLRINDQRGKRRSSNHRDGNRRGAPQRAAGASLHQLGVSNLTRAA